MSGELCIKVANLDRQKHIQSYAELAAVRNDKKLYDNMWRSLLVAALLLLGVSLFLSVC